jgi:hypothetical protein
MVELHPAVLPRIRLFPGDCVFSWKFNDGHRSEQGYGRSVASVEALTWRAETFSLGPVCWIDTGTRTYEWRAIRHGKTRSWLTKRPLALRAYFSGALGVTPHFYEVEPASYLAALRTPSPAANVRLWYSLARERMPVACQAYMSDIARAHADAALVPDAPLLTPARVIADAQALDACRAAFPALLSWQSK